jgi:hypothetical protein
MILKFLILVFCYLYQPKSCHLIKLNGYSNGDIPVSIVNKTTELEIEDGYIFESATFYVTGEDLQDPAPFRLNSLKLSADLVALLKKMKEDQHIVIDEIKVKKRGGSYQPCKTIGFKLVE